MSNERSERETRTRPRGVRMPEPTSCDNCGLTYYQTTAPHVCAEWTKGAEEETMTKYYTDHHGAHERSVRTEYEPAARGGEGEWRADSSGGWGYVWQGGACLAKCPEPSRAEQIVTEHNQHHSLLAEREGLREALSDVLTIVEDEGHVSNYIPQVTAARKVLAETALTTIRRESEK